jgi:hypothetical protein
MFIMVKKHAVHYYMVEQNMQSLGCIVFLPLVLAPLITTAMPVDSDRCRI